MMKINFCILFFLVINYTAFSQNVVNISNFECVKAQEGQNEVYVPYNVKFKINRLEKAKFLQIDCLNEKDEIVYAMTGFYSPDSKYPVFYLDGTLYDAQELTTFDMKIPAQLHGAITKFTLVVKDEEGKYSNQLASK